MQVLIGVLFVGIVAGLIGWINQSYLKEQMNWYTTMRPYMLTNVRPFALTAEVERALKPQQSFRECAKDCPEMVVVPAGSFTEGIAGRLKKTATIRRPTTRVTILPKLSPFPSST